MTGIEDSSTVVEVVAVPASETKQTRKRGGVNVVLLCTCFATMGGLMFGYDIGVIGGVKDMDNFRDTVSLPRKVVGQNDETEVDTQLGLIVSTFSLGCLTGSLIAGVVSEPLGRRWATCVGSAIFTVGGILQTATMRIWMMFLGRITAGLGIGILSMVVPLYIAEIAPREIRGRLVSLQQLSITCGIMISFIINLGGDKFLGGWRMSLSIQCVFSLILMFGVFGLPESPRWLVMKGRKEEAEKVMKRLRGSKAAEAEDEIMSELQAIDKEIEEERVLGKASWSMLLGRDVWKRTVLGVLIQLFQQFTGMNVIMYYSPSVFSSIRVPELVSTAIVGVINFLTTFLGIWLVDRVGRKMLLLTGAFGMTVSLLVAVALLLSYDPVESKVVGGMVVFLICVFVFCFAYSWGPTAWVVTSEIFPLRVRGKAVSITTTANWVGNFVVAIATPHLLDTRVLGIYGTFLLMAGFLVASFVFVLFFLPETKGRSLEEMNEFFGSSGLVGISDYLYYLKLFFCCFLCTEVSPTVRGKKNVVSFEEELKE